MNGRRVVVLGVVLCVWASGAFAQEPAQSQVSTLTVGSRVRVTSSLLQKPVPGVVEGLDDAVLTLRPDGGGVIKVSLASVSRVDVSLGRKRNVVQGLAVGGIAGFLLSFAMPVDPNACGSDDPNFCSRGEAFVGVGLAMAGIGAAVGALIKRERWTRITIAPSMPAGPGSARLALAVRF